MDRQKIIKNTITVTEDWSKNWQAKIAVRITSIFIWSLTFITIALAGLLMSQVKEDIITQQERVMDQIAYKVSHSFFNNSLHKPGALFADIETIISANNIDAIEIKHNDQHHYIGQVDHASETLVRYFKKPNAITITAHTPPRSTAIRDRQIEIFLIFSITLVSLGAFLGLIIDKYVHKPFQRLETATQEFISGNKAARVDIQSEDEFGVLAIFMNKMLDRINENEKKLKQEAQERKQAAQQVREQRDALQQITMELTIARDHANRASHEKSAFLANISHELRTPLNAVIGYSELLMEEAEDCNNDSAMTDLEKIRQAGKHLLTLINDVLDICKIESGKMDLITEDFCIHTMIEHVTDTIHPMIDKNNNRFNVVIPEHLKPMQSDVTRIKQILFNLLSNACKFTHDGHIELVVEKNSNGNIDFKVIDTGIGIDNKKINILFQEFTQADNSTTRNYGGTGLGLAISRRLCRLMHGNITVESTLGKGSTFIASIPMHSTTKAIPSYHEKNLDCRGQ